MRRLLEFIDNHGVHALEGKPYDITVKSYPGSIHILKYSQIAGAKFDPISRLCRGTIVSTANPDGAVLVARSFERFFNMGENPNEMPPLGRMRIDQKLDGSLLTVYWWNGKWNVATKGMAYAEGELNSGETFKELFEYTLGMSVEDFMEDLICVGKYSMSFVFELTTLENKVVTPYPVGFATLLTAFNLRGCFTEASQKVIEGVENDMMNMSGGIKPLDSFCGSVHDVEDAIDKLPANQEGFVIVWQPKVGGPLMRSKVKNSQYVDLHYAANNGVMTTRRILAILEKNEQVEFLTYFPEWTEKFAEVNVARIKVKDCCHIMKRNTVLWAMEQKEFAMQIAHFDYKAILFRMRKDESSFEDVWDGLRIGTKENILEAVINGK